MEAQSTASAPATKPSTRCSGVPAPPLAITGTSTAAEIVTAALQKDPDIVGIFAANLFAAEGSATGVQQAGKQGQVTIVGFDAAGDGIAALYLARRRGKELAYVGKAGTGLTQKSARELRQLLEPLVIDRPALTHAVRRPGGQMGKARELSAAIQYRAITSDGLLRHASFKGLHRPIHARRRSKPPAR